MYSCGDKLSATVVLLYSICPRHPELGQSTDWQLRAVIMGISPPPGTPPAALLGYGSIIIPVICHGSPRRVTSQSFPRDTPPITRGHRLVYYGLQAHRPAMTGKYLLKDYSIFLLMGKLPLTMYKVNFGRKWTPGEKIFRKNLLHLAPFATYPKQT